MNKFHHELDDIFSSSKDGLPIKPNAESDTNESSVNTPEADSFESTAQFISEIETDKESQLIVNEQKINCIEQEVGNSNISQSKKDTSENNQDGILSNMEGLVPRKIESNEGIEFPVDKHTFIDSCLQRNDEIKVRKLKEKEDKASKYYVVPIGPKPDFSSYGDFAEIMELGYAKELEEYNQKVEAMKKRKAEDLRLEKIKEDNRKAEIARERATKKIEKTLKKLQSQVIKFGHFSEVVGYNDSHSLVKLAIPRTYHRLLNNRGYIIKTAPFIEISQTKDIFYCYNYKLDQFELYANLGEETKGKFKLAIITKTQREMWDSIKKGDPEFRFGFSFVKYESFDSARYY